MLKKMKNGVKKQVLKSRMYIAGLVAAVYVILAGGMNVYASGFKGSIYETGTKKMMKDLLTVGQGLIAAIILVLWIVWELQKRASDNEEEKFSKKQKGALIGLILAETIGTLVGIIGGYYGVSIS